MKRSINNIFERICTVANLMQAYREAGGRKLDRTGRPRRRPVKQDAGCSAPVVRRPDSVAR